jgi:hypothetical protein
MYINITDSETGNNKGASKALVQYLEKENRISDPNKAAEFWFDGAKNDIIPQEVHVNIDNNIAKLGKSDAKFYLVNISPSQKEITYLKSKYGEQGTEDKLKEFATQVMDEYARNFKRPGIDSNRDLLWYGKLEHYRYYSYNDPEVQTGQRNEGERKEGDQMHIQVIVSRKDITNSIKLSPMNNSRGTNAAHSAKLGQFDRKAFKQSGEALFDRMFSFDRELKDTMVYSIAMKGDNAEEKKKLHTQETAGSNSSYSETEREAVSHTPPSLEQLLGFTEISGELTGSLFPLDNSGPQQEDIDPVYRKKKKKRRPPGQKGS